MIQLALQSHENIQYYLHKAEEVFVSMVLYERNVHFSIWLVNVIHGAVFFSIVFSYIEKICVWILIFFPCTIVIHMNFW